jgi:hypothetical protein
LSEVMTLRGPQGSNPRPSPHTVTRSLPYHCTTLPHASISRFHPHIILYRV